jgi:L-alanine-DL-glutamate epimerase-like enolase superfamily enzyme
MKVGRHPQEDLNRVKAVRGAMGGEADLFVDANGAYTAKQALALAVGFGELGVSWFEEPVSSDDLETLNLIRKIAPPRLEIAAGEYGFDAIYFQNMLKAGAVDVLQADVTRCGGVTGFLKVLALAEAYQIQMSTHCAPHLHLALGAHSSRIRHLEYFHDHIRIENALFEGLPQPKHGCLQPRDDLFGLGLILKDSEILEKSA